MICVLFRRMEKTGVFSTFITHRIVVDKSAFAFSSSGGQISHARLKTGVVTDDWSEGGGLECDHSTIGMSSPTVAPRIPSRRGTVILSAIFSRTRAARTQITAPHRTINAAVVAIKRIRFVPSVCVQNQNRCAYSWVFSVW